jgi:hypothetical protein
MIWASNQAGFGLSVAPQNQRREVGMRHVLRSSDLLHQKVCRVRVSQSGLKTGADVTVGGTRAIIAEITWC